MKLTTDEQLRLASSGAEIICYPSRQSASSRSFREGENVIFVHGFTADCGHLETLMERFHSEDVKCFAFNYPCFDGIDVAAMALFQLLYQFEQLTPNCLIKNRVTIVGHSMGGLVARALVGPLRGDNFVKRVITIGSPHGGTFPDAKFLACLLNWSQSVRRWKQSWAPPANATKMRSLMQLTGQDDERYLRSLWCETRTPNVDLHSVSGGHKWLDFCSMQQLNTAINLAVQKLMGDVTNDGLVSEQSSDLTWEKFGRSLQKAEHFNEYVEFHTTNHSGLVENQTLALKLVLMATSSP